ncbi:MAG: amidohydrolase family protein [Rhodospirillaceae bacterium]|nr:amidohydrolase family protein [Rhodospirillaceae bacterium]
MLLRALGAVVAMAVSGVAWAQDKAVLFENVTLIDGTGQPPLTGAYVLVEGERIAAVSPAKIKAPKGAARVDGKGKFLMPGLINTHIHLPGGREGPGNRKMVMNLDKGTKALHALLYSGVTAVYDSGNNVEFTMKMRADERAGAIVAPRLFITGRLVTRADGYQCCAGGIQVGSLEDGLAQIDALLARGPDMVKFVRERRGMGAQSENLNMVPLDVMGQLIAYVNDRGVRTTIHISEEQLARESIAAGIDALAHPVYLMDTDISFARMIAANRIPVSTTMGRVDTDTSVFDDPLFAATMSEEDRAENKENPLYKGTAAGEWRGGLMTAVRKNIRQLHDAGAILALGTDRSMGAFVHREMALLAEAGIPPGDVLRIATLNAAIYLGRERDLGSVERGKKADLLLLSGDPTQDIRNTEKIVAVFKGGTRIDRAALDVPANRPANRKAN